MRAIALAGLSDSSADVQRAATQALGAHPEIANIEPLLKLRRYRPAFLIDIALPRDVEPSVGELKNVYLYNLDDLQQVISETRSKRSDAVDHGGGLGQ